ncbi:MAG: type II secretion system protein [Akkermansiaceae bacterium]
MMNRRGFTLTEILIAIAIIGVLASIAMPIVSRVKRKTQQAVCLNVLRNLGVGLEGYLADHHDKMPDLYMGKRDKGSDESDKAVLENELLPYAGNNEFAFQCPADHELFEDTGSSYFWNESLSGVPRLKLDFMGAKAELGVIPLIFDKEAFHGDTNGVNFLYADQSASSKIHFDTGSRD